MTAKDAFTILPLVAHIAEVVQNIVTIGPELVNSFTAMSRLQVFLLLPEGQQSLEAVSMLPQLPSRSTGDEHTGISGTLLPSSRQRLAFALSSERIVSPLSSAVTLRNFNISIRLKTFTMLFGPSGSGKSTLLRAIIGELQHTHSSTIAYCGQHPWIENTSIKQNIIGRLKFDPVWYEVVLTACLLTSTDFRGGDEFIAGQYGSYLSAEQKQQIVRMDWTSDSRFYSLLFAVPVCITGHHVSNTVCWQAIARAVYSRAPVFVLDEVFSTLAFAKATKIFLNLFGIRGLLKKPSYTVYLASNLGILPPQQPPRSFTNSDAM